MIEEEKVQGVHQSCVKDNVIYNEYLQEWKKESTIA